MLTVSMSMTMSWRDGFPGRFVAVVPPGPGEGLAGLPGHGPAVDADPLPGHELLGRPVVPAARDVEQVEPVVDDDPGLELADHLEEALGLPLVPALAVRAGEREIHEQRVDPAVLGQQLLELAEEVIVVLGEVARRGLFDEGLVVAHGVVQVDRVVGMMPVEERVIEADPDALGPHGLDERPDEVLAVGRTGGLVIRELGVPQAEARRGVSWSRRSTSCRPSWRPGPTPWGCKDRDRSARSSGHRPRRSCARGS